MLPVESSSPTLSLRGNEPPEFVRGRTVSQSGQNTVQPKSEDQRLAEKVGRALDGAGYPSLRDLQVHAHNGYVTVRGRVPSYYLKQVAQSLAISVLGPNYAKIDVDVVCPR
jgi:osmotically-inducible protein OsmY